MQLGRIIETCLYVDNLAAAKEFYESILGLKAFAVLEGRHVFFQCGGGVFLLFDPAASEKASGDVPPHGARGPGHAAFEVSAAELWAWRERLGEHEVPIEAEVAWPGGGRSLYFRDPAGNSLELTTPETWGLDGGR